MNKEQLKNFEEAARPLVKYLKEQHHPHVTAVVTAVNAELVEGLMMVSYPYEYPYEEES